MRLISSLLWQCEHGERAAKRGVVAQRGVAANCAEAIGWIGQAGCEADASPSADAGQHRDELLAIMLVGRDVADDAGRGLELVKLLARLGVDCLQVAFQRSVED